MAHTRGLTDGERAGLSAGLVRALDRAGTQPWICDVPHFAARFSRLWRGHVPILTLGQTIHWPGAPPCFASSPDNMAILQHELHHVYEFATGALTPLGYIANPRNWFYECAVTATSRWSDFGAEQRAVLAEKLWQAERAAAHAADVERLKALIPWAQLELEGLPPSLLGEPASPR